MIGPDVPVYSDTIGLTIEDADVVNEWLHSVANYYSIKASLFRNIFYATFTIVKCKVTFKNLTSAINSYSEKLNNSDFICLVVG